MRLIDADVLDNAFTRLRFNADGELAHWGDRKDWCLHGSEVETLIADAPTVDAVPVNWIEDYLEKIHEDLDYARQDNDEEAMKRIFWKYETIRWMVADWRHDEKTR